MEKPSGGVLPAVEGHTLGTRYKLQICRVTVAKRSKLVNYMTLWHSIQSSKF